MDLFYRRRRRRWWRRQHREGEVTARRGCGCLLIIFALFPGLIAYGLMAYGSPWDREGKPEFFGGIVYAGLAIVCLVLGIRAISIARREAWKKYSDDD